MMDVMTQIQNKRNHNAHRIMQELLHSPYFETKELFRFFNSEMDEDVRTQYVDRLNEVGMVATVDGIYKEWERYQEWLMA